RRRENLTIASIARLGRFSRRYPGGPPVLNGGRALRGRGRPGPDGGPSMASTRPTALAIVLMIGWAPGAGGREEKPPAGRGEAAGSPSRPISPGAITGFGLGTENPLILLLAPAVQEELKLTDEQKAKVDDLARDGARKARDLQQSLYAPGANVPAILQ